MICRRSSPARRRSEASSSHRMFRFTSELIFSLCSKEARGFHHLLLSGLKQKGFPYSLSFFLQTGVHPRPQFAHQWHQMTSSSLLAPLCNPQQYNFFLCCFKRAIVWFWDQCLTLQRPLWFVFSHNQAPSQ